MTTATSNPTQYLDRGDGRIAYDVAGSGPLLVLVPGMGDLRSTYRHIAADLVAAGYRVTTCDLRGHGDSDATFAAYGDSETGSDLIALVEHLGGPATVVGNSLGAGAATWAAAERPELIVTLALLGPFVRDQPTSPLARLGMRIALSPMLARLMFMAYVPKLYPGRTPADHRQHLAAMRAGLAGRPRRRALSRSARASHAITESRLDEVRAATLVVMGSLDPDFADPQAEARWIADRLHGRVVMIPDAGHYPQSQRPELVLDALTGFLMENRRG
jgi:pimeloyl-ACP methyl ester carboxylesterase